MMYEEVSTFNLLHKKWLLDFMLMIEFLVDFLRGLSVTSTGYGHANSCLSSIQKSVQVHLRGDYGIFSLMWVLIVIPFERCLCLYFSSNFGVDAFGCMMSSCCGLHCKNAFTVISVKSPFISFLKIYFTANSESIFTPEFLSHFD